MENCEMICCTDPLDHYLAGLKRNKKEKDVIGVCDNKVCDWRAKEQLKDIFGQDVKIKRISISKEQ